MTVTERVSLSAVEAELAKRHLRDFLELIVWPTVEPETPFVGGFHIDAICEHLEAVSRREIRNLIITVPPRHTKSLCASVAFPTWEWIQNPESRFLTSSYSGDLSTDHAVLSRRVINSDAYQLAWGDEVEFQGDQNLKTYYENTRRGYRIATSVGGTATGRGGDFLICDDPHNLKKIHSDTERRGVVKWYRQVWSTRLNDPKTGCKVVIMQRGHDKDLAGYLIEEGGYDHLNLPTEYEPTQHFTSIGWRDPRTKKGELLCPDRFGPAEVENAKRELTVLGFATQHQQRPAPESGGMFKREKLQVITPNHLPQEERYRECRFWDHAATEEEAGKDPDYTAGVKIRHYLQTDLFVVMDVLRGRFGPEDGDEKMKAAAEGDGVATLVRAEEEGGASGKKVAAAWRKLMSHFDFDTEHPTGSKTTRARSFAVAVAAGKVRLLEGTWNDEYIDELVVFPNGDNDDQVDGSSGAFNTLYLDDENAFYVGPA